HRDLKHSNIMVTRDGVVKLLDFGIAKVQLNVAQAPDLTSPDYRLLTPNFASPEQVSGGAISKASDIYSLGVILYQILTGRLPHENPGDKLHKDPPLPSVNIREDLQRTPETTSQLRRRIVGDLDQIVLLCLRRDPKQRYATAADLAVDLDRFLEGRSVVARREPLMERAGRFLRRKKVAVAVAALVVLLCGAGAWEAVLAQNQTRLARSAEAEVRRLLDEMDRRQKAGRASGARKGQAKNGVMSAAAVAADVQQLRRIIQQDLGSGATARGPLSPERRDLLDRSAMYLNGISASTAGNPDLGLEVASAYQEIGVLYQNGYRDRALHAFTNAALVLAGMVEGDPRTGPYAARWVAVAELIRGLGGDVPVAVAQTTTHARGIAMDGASARRSPEVDTPAEEPMAKPEPGAATPAEPVNQAEYEEVRRLFVHASSRASTADDVMQQLQADASRQGQAVHPDIKQRINSMRDSLGLAREAMDAGKLAAAREDILAAETYASRVIKDGGGR
ncbi:MAG: serine/threonine-protein kinase, partial [Bryobacteraceae bacterium]